MKCTKVSQLTKAVVGLAASRVETWLWLSNAKTDHRNDQSWETHGGEDPWRETKPPWCAQKLLASLPWGFAECLLVSESLPISGKKTWGGWILVNHCRPQVWPRLGNSSNLRTLGCHCSNRPTWVAYNRHVATETAMGILPGFMPPLVAIFKLGTS